MVKESNLLPNGRPHKVMKQPILVVHGIANHDKTAFEATVATLSAKLEAKTAQKWPLIPVFWGDLGGQVTEYTEDLLPHFPRRATQAPNSEEIKQYLAIPPSDTEVRNLAANEDLIVEKAIDGSATPSLTRSSAAIQDLEPPLREAVAQELPHTQFLQFVSDPEILESLGVALGAATKPTILHIGDKAVRGFSDNTFEIVKGAAVGVIRGFDAAIGAVAGRVLGNLNNELREQQGPAIIRSLGDIMAYERDSKSIGNRLWETLAAYGFENYGTKDKPVNVIAHSLGGVVAFDAANRARNSLYINKFLTFGSQSAFFNVVAPRHVLPLYRHGHSIELGETIGQWVNLFEPMDFLAFAASPVFSMANPDALKDKMIAHRFSYGIYTHSIYWQTDELQQEIVSLMG